jgi:hypothetical protein
VPGAEPESFERFRQLARKVVAVPKVEMQKKRTAADKDRRRRPPKPA